MPKIVHPTDLQSLRSSFDAHGILSVDPCMEFFQQTPVDLVSSFVEKERTRARSERDAVVGGCAPLHTELLISRGVRGNTNL